MKKLIKSSLILLGLLLPILSFCQENEVFEKLVLSPGECEFEYIKKVNYLKSSLESVPLLTVDKTLVYFDEDGSKNKFSCTIDELPVWCEHQWTCDKDTSYHQKYWVPRPSLRKILRSKEYKIEYFLSTVVNEIEPTQCSDIFYVSIESRDEKIMTSKLIIDQRTDLSKSDDKLKLHSEIKIGETLFNNVYEDTKDNTQILFSLEQGILLVKNTDDNKSLRIK